MNKRIKQLSEARQWIVAIVMFLIICGMCILSVFPSHAFSKGAATTTLKSWKAVEGPNVGSNDNGLNEVGVVSANDIWAVGSYVDSTNINQTLIQHWHGSAWTVISSPNVATSYNFLNGVAVVSAKNVWTVGYYQNTSTGKLQTLTEHWNGSAWNIVSSPNAGLTYDRLTAVAVVSSSDVWAVGNHDASNAIPTLIEHWDGSVWTIISSPNVGTSYNILNNIAVVSASNIWAVGYHDTTGGSFSKTLIVHWNGSTWRVVSSPNIGTSEENSLGGVAIVSASNIWAVGYYRSTSLTKEQTLIEHYS